MVYPIYLPGIKPPENVRPVQFPGMTMTWTDCNGIKWDLADHRSGVFLLGDDVEGLAMPKGLQRNSKSAAVHGTRAKLTRIEQRSVFWPIYIYTPGRSEGFQDIDALFWEGMVFDRPGVWEVSIPGQPLSRRRLVCSFVSDGDHTFKKDPLKTGWQIYGVELVAHQPFWEGDIIQEEFISGGVVEFFGPTGNDGPPFNLSNRDTLTNSSIVNPGQVEAYPVWDVIGPTTSVSLGVSGRLIELPFPIADGEAVEINTDPTSMSVTRGAWSHEAKALYGVVEDVYPLLGKDQFEPIPAGGRKSLQVNITGAGGSARVRIRPKYYRAYGRKINE